MFEQLTLVNFIYAMREWMSYVKLHNVSATRPAKQWIELI